MASIIHGPFIRILSYIEIVPSTIFHVFMLIVMLVGFFLFEAFANLHSSILQSLLYPLHLPDKHLCDPSLLILPRAVQLRVTWHAILRDPVQSSASLI